MFLTIFASVLTLAEVTGLLPKLRGYFNQTARRTQRAQLFALLAKDFLAVVRLQKGLSASTEEIVKAAIDMLTDRLVGSEGVKRETAKALAERLIAGALAENDKVK